MIRFTIPARISISALAFVIPLAVLLYFFVAGINEQINFGVQEKVGDAYLRPVVKTLRDVTAYEKAVLSHSGDLTQLRTVVDDDFKALEKAQRMYGERLQFTEEGLASRDRKQLKLDRVQTKWNDLADSVGTDMDKLKEAYVSLVADLRGLIAHAGDTSNLILDPDLDSYYLMDVILAALPQAFDRAHAINQSVQPLYTGQALDEKTRDSLILLSGMLKESDIGRAAGDLDTSFKEDKNYGDVSPTLKPNLEPKMAAFQQAHDALQALLLQVIEGKHVSGAEMNKVLTDLRETGMTFWSAGTDELDLLLNTRINNFTAHRTLVLVGFGIALLFAVGFFVFVSRSITVPLKKLQAAMLDLASGNLESKIPYLSKKDEIGEMAKAVQVFKKTSVEAITLQEGQKREHERQLGRQKQVEALVGDFKQKAETLLKSVSQSAGTMKVSAESMANDATQTDNRLGQTVSATTETSAAVSAVAAAAEELSASITEISRLVSRSAGITQEAVEKAQSADGTIQQLSDSAVKINEIISLIGDIAEQINLLALNATIESARAGEAGKGFAVVASEVKALAGQTSKATEAISEQISGIQGVVQAVVSTLNNIRSTINEMGGISTNIASAVEEQGAATQEIARNIQMTSSRVQEMSSNIHDVGAMSKMTNQNSQAVLESINTFSGQSETLNSEIGQFLQRIASV